MKTNVKPLVPLTFPRVRAYEHSHDYKISKIEAKRVRYGTCWEVARASPQVDVVTAKRKLRTAGILLEKWRESAIQRRKNFNTKWDEVNEKQTTFKNLFRKFNAFVRANQEKRERAERKINEELMLQQKRTDDIKQMSKNYSELKAIKILMENKVKDHKFYEDYLTSVVKSTSFYKNVNDLLYRHESLIETRAIVCEKQEADLAALENAKTNMMKLIEEKQLKLVGLLNQVGNLEARYHLAYEKSLQWEYTVSTIQDISSEELSKLDQVRSVISYIYKEMCKRKNVEPAIPAVNYEEQLKFIKKALLDLRMVLQKLHKKV